MQSIDSLEQEYSRLIAAAGELQADLRKCPDETGTIHTLEKQLLNQLGEALTALGVLQWVMGYRSVATPSSQALRHKPHSAAAVALQPEIDQVAQAAVPEQPGLAAQPDQAGTPGAGHRGFKLVELSSEELITIIDELQEHANDLRSARQTYDQERAEELATLAGKLRNVLRGGRYAH